MTIALIAKRLDQPYPIALVVGGFVVALIPGVPKLPLNPELVFFLLLPPVLTEAAFFTSWRDFWRWKRSIFLLAFGLVTATSAVVAALCVWFIPGMTWAAGFVLGAIVSPPDAAAATSITRGLKLPRRIVQIIEGESLVNDAAALTVYRFAVAAVVTGSFSFGGATLSFLWIAIGGAAIGAGLGYLYVKLYSHLKDPEVEVLSTFLLSYLSYFAAEAVYASGVLSTVASGLILGWHAPAIFNATTRIRGNAVWQTSIFFINVVIFFFIGLELPGVIADLKGFPVDWLLWWSAIIAGGVMGVRFVWVFAGAYLPRWLSKTIRATEPRPTAAAVTVVAWTGLRGVVSLAAALALPRETASGLPFPYRNLIELLTIAVIGATLLVQGMTLRPLVRRLRLPQDHSSEEEQLNARIFAIERVVERVGGASAPAEAVDRVRGFYENRLTAARAQLEDVSGTERVDRPEQFASIAEQRLWWEMAQIEREALLELRRTRKIGDEAMHEIERDLDLLEARIVPRG